MSILQTISTPTPYSLLELSRVIGFLKQRSGTTETAHSPKERAV